MHIAYFCFFKSWNEVTKSEKGENLGRGPRVVFLINWTVVPLFSTHSPLAPTFDQISWSKRERAARFYSFCLFLTLLIVCRWRYHQGKQDLRWSNYFIQHKPVLSPVVVSSILTWTFEAGAKLRVAWEWFSTSLREREGGQHGPRALPRSPAPLYYSFNCSKIGRTLSSRTLGILTGN